MQIIRAIETGFRASNQAAQCCIIEDRAEAIHEAMRLARAGDVVVIAGKGHESYQTMGDKHFPFDDRLVATHALQEQGYWLSPTAPP
jgi:UDP-N-acetylmuramoyl-L-alanyl-D-glutamate--2,6-diaminopimelate ligase